MNKFPPGPMIRYKCLFLFPFLFIILALLLSGCSFFEAPPVKPQERPPAQWISHDANFKIDERVNLPDTAWWRKFHDAQLDELIQKALQENNSVNMAIANLEYSENELKQVKLNWLPGMNILGGYSQMPTLGDPLNFIGLIPSYTINLFQQVKQQQTAQHQVEASRYAKDSVRLTVIGQVAGSYFTLLALSEELQWYKQLLNDNNTLLQRYQTLYHSGIIAQDDIERLQSQIKQIRSQIAITEHDIIVSKNALHYLLNENPGNWVLKTPFRQIDSNQVIPGNLPVTVLNNRPDVQETIAALKVADANIGATAAGLLPTIQLSGFLNYRTSTHQYETLKEADANIPLFNPIFGDIGASQSTYKAQYIHYVDTVKRALRDVENDLSAYTAYTTQLERNVSALNNEEQKCHLVDSRYRYGIDSEVQVLECRIKLDYFQLMLNQDKLGKMLTIVALYQDLGGGYNGA